MGSFDTGGVEGCLAKNGEGTLSSPGFLVHAGIYGGVQ